MTIDGEVERITKIVNSMLDFTRIDSDKLELEKELCNFAELVINRIEVARALYTDHIFQLRSHLYSLPLLCDPLRLEQVITNILTNAVKYSNPNTIITVRLDESSEHYQLQIEDQGYGMTRQDMQHIFEPFFQGKQANDNRQRSSQKGLGLGLYISQRIIELHQGTLTVTSVVDQGSTFTITLPKNNQTPLSRELSVPQLSPHFAVSKQRSPGQRRQEPVSDSRQLELLKDHNHRLGR